MTTASEREKEGERERRAREQSQQSASKLLRVHDDGKGDKQASSNRIDEPWEMDGRKGTMRMD